MIVWLAKAVDTKSLIMLLRKRIEEKSLLYIIVKLTLAKFKKVFTKKIVTESFVALLQIRIMNRKKERHISGVSQSDPSRKLIASPKSR